MFTPRTLGRSDTQVSTGRRKTGVTTQGVTYNWTGSPKPSDFLLGTLIGLGAVGDGNAVGPRAFVIHTYRPEAKKVSEW